MRIVFPFLLIFLHPKIPSSQCLCIWLFVRGLAQAFFFFFFFFFDNWQRLREQGIVGNIGWLLFFLTCIAPDTLAVTQPVNLKITLSWPCARKTQCLEHSGDYSIVQPCFPMFYPFLSLESLEHGEILM
ncbi:hypothetical protein QBC38DRAFT_231711 [Podospora fimiseda]|uniref:Uncharacterized protein n=1 Tax=Podospora fimiseda TaxID=252190 RepID=A0AAN7H2I9_9PEZI|nr:hypothetical protein QBC38DRAFT_231711 [Podospora fimiseda]